LRNSICNRGQKKRRKGAGVGPTQWAKKCVTCKCRQRLENLLEFDAINALSTVLGAGGEQEAGQQVKSTPPQWQRQ